MALPTPQPGMLISYSYLWQDQKLSGETDGRKARPCAIVVASIDDDGDTIVYVVPITHRKPTDGPDALELPRAVKSRLKLDDEPSWIVTSELNRFVWPGYDLRLVARDKPGVFSFGFLPVEVFEAIKKGVARRRKQQRLKVVDRS